MDPGYIWDLAVGTNASAVRGHRKPPGLCSKLRGAQVHAPRCRLAECKTEAFSSEWIHQCRFAVTRILLEMRGWGEFGLGISQRFSFSKLEDNYFILLCWFLLYKNVNETWVSIYPLPPEPPFTHRPAPRGHHRALGGAPPALQQLPISYLFYIRYCVCFSATLHLAHPLSPAGFLYVEVTDLIR